MELTSGVMLMVWRSNGCDGKGYFYSVGRLDLVCGIHSWNWIPYIDLFSCIYLVMMI